MTSSTINVQAMPTCYPWVIEPGSGSVVPTNAIKDENSNPILDENGNYILSE